MPPSTKESQRAELHKMIWRIANDLRGSVDGWDFRQDGAIRTTGTAITRVLPPVSRFSGGGGHGEKKQRVIQKLGAFFERFVWLGAKGEE